MWLQNERFQRLGGGLGERFAVGTLAKLQFFLLGAHKKKEVLDLLLKVRRDRHCLLTGFEEFNIYTFARSRNHLPGEMAEVGVYDGASARLICEARGGRPLHLFDTFEGLPKSSEKDKGVYKGKSEQYKSTLESVQTYLREYDDVSFYKGLFPETAGPIEDRQFSFVHLDVDLYDSTLECLKFFYPRMTPGGMIVSHDYSLLAGVKTAFDEFLADKQDQAIELCTSQCMLVKA